LLRLLFTSLKVTLSGSTKTSSAFSQTNRFQVSRLSTFDFSTVELENGDQIYLKSFESNKIDDFISFVNENKLVDTTIHATGGGAYKY
jgi:pantothenate kinase